MFRNLKLRLTVKNLSNISRRQFASGHGHVHGPHVPEAHALVGKCLLIMTYLWVMYRLKEDKGQLFGFYKPWLHEHEHDHEEQVVYIKGGIGELSTIQEYSDDDDEDDEDHA